MTLTQQQIDHENQRKQCWMLAAAHTANAESCRNADTAINWADSILRAFDRKFPAPTTSTSTSKSHAKES